MGPQNSPVHRALGAGAALAACGAEVLGARLGLEPVPACRRRQICCRTGVSDRPGLEPRTLEHKGCRVTLVVNEARLGAPMSRNVGIGLGTADYVLFLDDDVRAPRDLLRRYSSGHNILTWGRDSSSSLA